MEKNLFIAVFGVVLAPFIESIEKYLYNDWDFLKFLFPLILLDTFLGVAKNWKYGTLSHEAWGKIIWKLITYASILILAHIITHYTIEGRTIIVFSWFDEAIYSALMAKEGISILENLGAINPNLVPRWLLQRLKDFDTNGKFKEPEPQQAAKEGPQA